MSANKAQHHSTSQPSGNRRWFHGKAAQAAFGIATLSTAPAIVRGRNLNERMRVAVIGTGGRGAANLQAVEADCDIVALVDVNESNLNVAAQRHSKARKLKDFRKLFDHAGEFDAVIVSTCEHTHAFATLPALQLKKHVYCEKPLTHNVWEARVIREAAAKANVTTQMGIQIHSMDNYRRVVELIQGGAIGNVSEVHVWVSRAWGLHASEEAEKASGDIVIVRDRPVESHSVPSELDWDLWLGPAPARSYHSVYFPGPKWYRWWDFGSGTMSDLGSHWIDLPFWALNLDYPLSIEAFGPPAHPELAPASMHVTYEYAARGERQPLNLTWYQGTHRPEILQSGKIPQWDSGVLFIGDQGMLLADYGQHRLLPEEKFADFVRPPQTIPSSPGQQAEWVLACKSGLPTSCNFEYSGWLTEANHLGNVAYRVGKKLFWDPVSLKATNAPEADRFIRREYRKGWELT